MHTLFGESTTPEVVTIPLSAFLKDIPGALKMAEASPHKTVCVTKKDRLRGHVPFFYLSPSDRRNGRFYQKLLRGGKKTWAKAYPGLDFKRLEHPSSTRELAFAKFWAQENTPNTFTSRPMGLFNGQLSKRDTVVAATIVQWLGTNCGVSFLCEVIKRSPLLARSLKGAVEKSAEIGMDKK
jgi:hypothetical protein